MKRFLVLCAVVAIGLGLFFWNGWLTVTPAGKEAGRTTLVEGKAQARRLAAWTLEKLFEK